jgi:hypothetical protein
MAVADQGPDDDHLRQHPARDKDIITGETFTATLLQAVASTMITSRDFPGSRASKSRDCLDHGGQIDGRANGQPVPELNPEKLAHSEPS